MNGLPWTNDVATYKLIYLRTQARLFTVIGFRVMVFFKPKPTTKRYTKIRTKYPSCDKRLEEG
jgi:hypothetical protein